MLVTMTSLFADGEHWPEGGAGAVYCDGSPACHRYRLWRVWDKTKPIAMFLMLNPSTATHLELDPTLRRCRGYAKDWNYGGFEVGNLFAFRATDPEDMKGASDPVGLHNDDVVVERAREIAKRGGIVVAGWGAYGDYRGRCWDVKARFMREEIKLHYLKLTKGGHPGHPLYLPKRLTPQEWV